MPDISVYDSSAVSERVAAFIVSDFEIAIVEWTSQSESVTTPNIPRTIDKSESVSIVDSPTISDTLGPEFFGVYFPMPIWEGQISFSLAINTRDNLRLPIYSLQGQFGTIVEGNAPAYRGSASFAIPSEYISVAGKLPTASLEATFGSILTGRIPTYSITASFLEAGYLTLDKVMPVWGLTAELSAPRSITLDAKIPIWLVSSSVELTGLLISVDAKIPGAFLLNASISEDGSISLDKTMPLWRLTSTAYSTSINLDSTMPVWIIEESGNALIHYPSEMSDYILRYVRP